jgi:hypothetical protein
MNWLAHHWQTIAAFTIVAATVAVFVIRSLRRRKGCGGNCGCDAQNERRLPPRR